MSVLDDRLERAVIESVKGAGELLLGMDAVHEIRAKNRTDFVTDVDMAVQARLSRELASLAPEVQFMGEERDNSDIDPARPFWILDPVDGTTNLIRRLRRSAVSLALAEGGRTVLGVVYNPYAPELYTALRGGERTSTGGESPSAASRPCPRALGQRRHRARPPRMGGHGFPRDAFAVRHLPSTYAAAAAPALISATSPAGGWTPMWERYLCPWDYAAGAPDSGGGRRPRHGFLRRRAEPYGGRRRGLQQRRRTPGAARADVAGRISGKKSPGSAGGFPFAGSAGERVEDGREQYDRRAGHYVVRQAHVDVVLEAVARLHGHRDDGGALSAC